MFGRPNTVTKLHFFFFHFCQFKTVKTVKFIYRVTHCITTLFFKSSQKVFIWQISVYKGGDLEPVLNGRDLKALRQHCIKNRHDSVVEIAAQVQECL